MKDGRSALRSRKTVMAAAFGALVLFAGRSFYHSRQFKEPLVAGPGVTAVKKLSEYFPALRGTMNDANVYVLDGKGNIKYVNNRVSEKLGYSAPPGSHTVIFVNAEEGKKVTSVVCKAGETKTVAVRLSQ